MGIYIESGILNLKGKRMNIKELDKLILGMYNGYLNPIFTKEANTRVYKSKDGIAFRFNYELIKQEVYPENNLVNIKGLELY